MKYVPDLAQLHVWVAVGQATAIQTEAFFHTTSAAHRLLEE